MNLVEFLQNFDLSETESKVYLSSLKRPHIDVAELSTLSGVKRTTIYHALETLHEKGFIKKIGKGPKFRYQPESPEHLERLIDRQEVETKRLKKKLAKSLPLFPSVEDYSGNAANVEIFRGKSGLYNLGEKIYTSKNKEILSIAPSFASLKHVATDDEMLDYMHERAKRKIQTKSIWVDLPKNSSLLDNKTLLREVRLAPNNILTGNKTKIDIFDNTVLIINFLPEMTGLLITSVDYADVMKSLWHLLWGVSTPLE